MINREGWLPERAVADKTKTDGPTDWSGSSLQPKVLFELLHDVYVSFHSPVPIEDAGMELDFR